MVTYPPVKRGWLENPRTKWRFLAGKIIYKCWNFHCQVLLPEGTPTKKITWKKNCMSNSQIIPSPVHIKHPPHTKPWFFLGNFHIIGTIEMDRVMAHGVFNIRAMGFIFQKPCLGCIWKTFGWCMSTIFLLRLSLSISRRNTNQIHGGDCLKIGYPKIDGLRRPIIYMFSLDLMFIGPIL